MKQSLFILACIAVIACGRAAPRTRRATQPSSVETVDSVTPAPAVLQPPATLTDEGPAPKSGGDVPRAGAPAPPTPQDDALRASLPFAPAIAMDPVDGSKISIRATTPTADYKGHIFYFSSEANKRTFMSKPDQFTKGAFAHL